MSRKEEDKRILGACGFCDGVNRFKNIHPTSRAISRGQKPRTASRGDESAVFGKRRRNKLCIVLCSAQLRHERTCIGINPHANEVPVLCPEHDLPGQKEDNHNPSQHDSLLSREGSWTS